MRCAVLVFIVACAHSSQPSKSELREQALTERVFERLDGLLDKLRPQLCSELGQSPPASAPAPPASRAAACDAGSAKACVAAGDMIESSDRARALELFKRGCDAGDRVGCYSAMAELKQIGDGADRITFVREQCRAGRIAVCGRLWPWLPADERAALAPELPTLRTALEAGCRLGNEDACASRADLDCHDNDRDCPFRPNVWRLRACTAGAGHECMYALHALDADAISTTLALVSRACRRGRCSGLVAGLADSCQRGAWSSCYFAANACRRGRQLPAARDDDHAEDD
jgi:hypothetical protein